MTFWLSTSKQKNWTEGFYLLFYSLVTENLIDFAHVYNDLSRSPG